MTSNACTPDNVIGRMLGMREANGLPVGKELLDELDTGGKYAYSKQSNAVGADLFDSSETKGRKSVGWLEKAVGNPIDAGKRILTDQAGPDEILGNELIDQMDELVQEHLQESGGKAQFIEDARDILDSFANDYSGTKESYFKEYKDWMMNGGPLYAKERKTGTGQAIANLGDNAIKSSFTVLLGNPIEVAIKLPSLYPKEAAQGLKNWLEAGDAIRKIPELEKIGFYGLERKSITDASLFEKANHKWAGINEAADIPWKNLVYHTGKISGGHAGGLKAVEDVLFNQRMANLPRQRWGQSGRVESKLLNYSINSVKLGYDLMKGTVTGDKKAQLALAIMSGSILAMGGPGALIPQPIDDFLKKVNPDYEGLPEWGAAGLIKQQGIGRVGIPFDMANRQGGKAWKSLVDAGKSGVSTRSAVDVAHALVSLAAFSQGWAGDAAVQKGLGLVKDSLLDELDEDFWTDTRNAYLPFTRAK